jgi:hypothetical protein
LDKKVTFNLRCNEHVAMAQGGLDFGVFEFTGGSTYGIA